jgi:hypothetical protein
MTVYVRNGARVYRRGVTLKKPQHPGIRLQDHDQALCVTSLPETVGCFVEYEQRIHLTSSCLRRNAGTTGHHLSPAQRFFARRPDITGQVLGIVYRVIASHPAKKTGQGFLERDAEDDGPMDGLLGHSIG